MNIKAAIFDIDGTLVPVGTDLLPARTAAALRGLQAKGVPVIVATGRARFAAMAILNGFVPDYLVAVCGAQTTDGAGRTLAERCMTSEEMYALVDFFEDYELPLSFTFPDGYYGYVESETLRQLYGPFGSSVAFMHDGEDQTRHLTGMPHGAAGCIGAERRAQFTQKYGYLGLRILPFHGDMCDILGAGVDKSLALGALLERLGIGWADTAAFGDGSNDAAMLAAAGMAVAMGNGAAVLQETAHLVAPPAAEDGAAQVIERLWL